MEQHAIVTPQNIARYLVNKKTLICSVRNSRSKCKQLAALELLQLLSGFAPLFITNGPLSDVKGIISLFVTLEEKDEVLLCQRLAGAGYCDVFYLLDFANLTPEKGISLGSINPLVWKRRPFVIRELYRQDETEFYAQAADRRSFRLMCGDGIVRDVQGYRGDGKEMGRRALPTEDCRLLVNLGCCENTGCILDPFAGGGGIVYQARAIHKSIVVASNDIAPELAPGLEAYGAVHSIGSAEDYVAGLLRFDAIITEVPFAAAATAGVCRAFIHLTQFMNEHCRIALMCAPEQTTRIQKSLENAGCYCAEAFPLNRKGRDVEIVLAFRHAQDYEDFQQLWRHLRLFY